MYSYNLHLAQPEEDWLPLVPLEVSTKVPAFSRELFLATVLLHLHCLLFVVLGWVSADVKRNL